MSNHAISKMVFFTTTCRIREIELRFDTSRNGYVVVSSKHKTLKVGCKVAEIDEIKIGSKTQAELSEIIQLVKDQVEVLYTTPELDPINPTRDHEIFPVCLRFYTLLKKEKSFGFSVTTKSRENSNKFIHTIGRVIENGSADIAGIRNKMRIQSINGQLAKSLSHKELVKLVSSCESYLILAVREVCYKTVQTFTGRIVFKKIM